MKRGRKKGKCIMSDRINLSSEVLVGPKWIDRSNSYSLFCPTVGPILSAGIPGIGLYIVFIRSSIVYLSQTQL